MFGTLACVVVAAPVSQVTMARAEPQRGPSSAATDGAAKVATTEVRPRGSNRFADGICRALTRAAADNSLPEEFFTRLIWEESRFDPGAVSRAGAQGIAQFMPETAATRGLANAFEPLQSLREFGEVPARAAYGIPGGPGSGCGGLQMPVQPRSKPGLPAVAPFPQRRLLTFTSLRAIARKRGLRGRWHRSSCSERNRKWRALHRVSQDIDGDRTHPSTVPSGSPWGTWAIQLTATGSEGDFLVAYEGLRRKYSAILGASLPPALYAGSTFVVRVPGKSSGRRCAVRAAPRCGRHLHCFAATREAGRRYIPEVNYVAASPPWA